MRGRCVVLLALLVAAACGGDTGDLTVDDARLGQPTGPNAALYFTATSNSEADRLVGATTDSAASVELHETTVDDDGTMAMSAIDGLDLPAGGALVLEPGSYHLMLVDAERMDVGDVVEVLLIWDKAGEMTVEAEVVDPGDTMGNDG